MKAQPCEGSLNYPSTGQEGEALGIVAACNNLKRESIPLSESPDPLDKVTGIPAICPDPPQTNESMRKLFEHSPIM